VLGDVLAANSADLAMRQDRQQVPPQHTLVAHDCGRAPIAGLALGEEHFDHFGEGAFLSLGDVTAVRLAGLLRPLEGLGVSLGAVDGVPFLRP
jgi:hypothetical protein